MWKYKIGTVVQSKQGEWGHIVGFAKNATEDTIIAVRFSADEDVRNIHPSNLTFK